MFYYVFVSFLLGPVSLWVRMSVLVCTFSWLKCMNEIAECSSAFENRLRKTRLRNDMLHVA